MSPIVTYRQQRFGLMLEEGDFRKVPEFRVYSLLPSLTVFLMEVRRGDEERRAIAAGRDIYATTAPIIVEAVVRILAGGIPATGTAAPGQIFDAEAFLQALSPEHISWE